MSQLTTKIYQIESDYEYQDFNPSWVINLIPIT